MSYSRSTFTAACLALNLTPTTAEAISNLVTKTWKHTEPDGGWQKAHDLLARVRIESVGEDPQPILLDPANGFFLSLEYTHCVD